MSAKTYTPEQERAILHDVDFDADSKGDAGRVLNVRMVTAAKHHAGACYPCLGDIAPGERHRVERYLYDGKVTSGRTCATCCQALSKWCSSNEADQAAIQARYELGRERSRAKRQTNTTGGAKCA
ncbi:MAG: hypothetical protein AB7P37_03455 [Ramlibacter sp.]